MLPLGAGNISLVLGRSVFERERSATEAPQLHDTRLPADKTRGRLTQRDPLAGATAARCHFSNYPLARLTVHERHLRHKDVSKKFHASRPPVRTITVATNVCQIACWTVRRISSRIACIAFGQ